MAFTCLAGELVDESDAVVLRRIDGNVTTLVAEIEAEAKRRKITMILTGIGAVFAAAKFGFIAIPHIRAWRDSK